MSVPHEYLLWLELIVVLTIATTAIVAVAALVERMIAPAVWRRMLWQASAAGLVLLLLFEVTGVGRGLGAWVVALRPQVHDGQRAASTFAQGPGDNERGGALVRRASGPHRGANGPHDSAQPAHGFGDDGAGSMAAVVRTGEDTRSTTTGARLPEVRVSDERPLADGADPGRGSRVLTGGRHERLVGSSSWGDLTAANDGVPRSDCGLAAEPPAERSPLRVTDESDSVAADRRSSGAAAGQIDPLPAEPFPLWPAVIWLTGAFALAAYLLMGCVLLSLFRWRSSSVADASILGRVGRLAGRLGIRASVRVIQSPRLKTPVAFGVLAPTVGLPSRFATDFAADEQEAILIHELAHLVAADPAWQLAVNWLCVLLWWQPAVWWLRRRLAAASEAAADEASLVVPGGPQALASCLVAMGRRLIDTPRLGWLPMTGDGYRSNLGRRVTHLLALDARRWQMPRRTRVGLVKSMVVVVLVVAMVFCTSWVRPRSVPTTGEMTMMQWKLTWSRSLAAAGLAVLLGSVYGDTAAEQPQRPDEGVAGILVAQADGEGEARRDRDREEGEREVRRDGDREEGPREGDVRRDGDRERGEREGDVRRDREHAEHEEREEREEEENPERVLHELNREREELTDLVRELRHELEELPDDADEEARGIREEIEGAQHEIRGVEAEMREMVHRHGERDRPRHLEEVLHRLMREREELMRHGHELEGALERNREEGREGAVGELEEELADVRRRMQAIERETQEIRREGGERDRPRGEGEAREEIERRLHHLRVAAENLRAAGMHEHAQHLMQQAENLARELGPGERDRPREPRPDGPPRDPRVDRPGPEQLERAVRELHGQMQEMRRQMEEMRGVLRELVEREKSRDR